MLMMVKGWTVSLIFGYFLDMLLGDPYCFPHPVKAMGKCIAFLEKRLYRKEDHAGKQFRKGMLLSILVLFSTFICSTAVYVTARKINPVLGVLVGGIMTYQCLAAKQLYIEADKVRKALLDTEDPLEKGRYAVSMIVGRDTENLDAEGIVRATVETIAENTSDGEVAPMFYLMIGGPVLGMLYKAVNTMDSMMGYRNEKYEYFGKFAAKLDDVVNFIPSRVAAFLMIISSFILGFSGRNAYRIWKRDRFNHDSPNSAQTESVMAGALRIQLAGDAYYFGKKKEKPTIGDPHRKIQIGDIVNAGKILITTSLMTIIAAIMIRMWFLFVIMGQYHYFD